MGRDRIRVKEDRAFVYLFFLVFIFLRTDGDG
jgi:hypothetical protein